MNQVEPTEGFPVPRRSAERRRWAAGAQLAAALIAGAIAWWCGERIAEAYRAELFPRLKISPSNEDLARLTAARVGISRTTYATLGGLLGLALGAAGGLSRGARCVALGAVLGGTLGAAAGGGVAAIVAPLFYRWRDSQSTDLLGPLLTLGAIWSAIGAAVGLAFGVGSGDRRRALGALAGAAAGGLLAALVYEVVGALAFSTSRTDLPVSTASATRAGAAMLLALLTAAGAAWGAWTAEAQKGPAATAADPSTGVDDAAQ